MCNVKMKTLTGVEIVTKAGGKAAGPRHLDLVLVSLKVFLLHLRV